MAPIRLGIIGLSSRPGSWAAVAHVPYLLSPHGRARYEIVALCNSSVESARSAIKSFGLSPETRAYGDPSDLARDTSIELVICSTRVDRHYDTIKPSISAGKAVFVEWPLASSVSQARDLATLATNGNIGKVLGSNVKAWGGLGNSDTIPESLRYFTQLSVGGNAITIGFGHLWEFLLTTLGDVSEIQSTVKLRWPRIRLVSQTGTIGETVDSDVPDLVSVTALLEPSLYVQDGAPIHVTFQRNQPFHGEPRLKWTILGETGELTFIAEGTTPRTMASEPITIMLRDFSTGKTKEIPWAWEAWQQTLPVAARGVAGLYEAYAQGDPTAYRNFEYGLKRHEQLADILSCYP
ncbi:oxidoreductase family [Fusarium beomiforme]|uniref:Oxidoreductase family n=1 Tax=Fusarium beomiforme TaxID=44412 RepID=A0A9P5A7A3_9HYPO|nr:oxidoreductase family [Fusarium beomiforme]